MKFKLLIILSVAFVQNSFCQVLIEDRNTDPLYAPLISSTVTKKQDAGLVKVNIADQSIGGVYFRSFKKDATNKYKYITAGIKAKPTEGYASVFKNSQFSAGTTISFSMNWFKILDEDKTKADEGEPAQKPFTDWGGIYVNAPFNKYQMYRSDTTFGNQLYSKTLNGFEIGGIYSALFNTHTLFSIKAGYSRTNNFSDLPEVVVSDIKSTYDTVTKVNRQVQTSKTARQGKLIEYDLYSAKISLIRLTADNTDKAFSIGYGAFLDIKSPAIKNPTTDLGLLIYLAQTKSGVSTPLISFIVQFNDLGDNNHLNNGLQKRVQLGLSTTIPINTQ